MEFNSKNLRKYCCGEDRFALAYSEDNGKHMRFISSIEPLCFATAKEKALVMPFENATRALRYLYGVPEKTDICDLFANLMRDWFISYDGWCPLADVVQNISRTVIHDLIEDSRFDPSEVWEMLTMEGWNEDDFEALGIYKLVHSEVNDDGELVYRDSNGEEEIISEQ